MARAVMDQIVKTGQVSRGHIGVSIQDSTPAGAAVEGALIAAVSPNSPAQAAGIRKGDLVVKADDVPVRSAAQLRNKVGLTPVGMTIQLTIRRGDSLQKVEVAIVPADKESRSSPRRR
jgi:serine protease Do